MSIECFPVGPLETNCCVVYKGKKALVVDPGATLKEGLQKVLDFLQEKELDLEAILITHFHFDHIYGVKVLHETTKAPVYGGKVPEDYLDIYFQGGSRWGLPKVTPFEWNTLEEGTQIFGDIEVQIFEVPGHSPESLAYYFAEEQSVCTGDTLFHTAIGRTDFPNGSAPTLIKSIREKLFTLPDETKVYPGHDRSTSIAFEKQCNPYL